MSSSEPSKILTLSQEVVNQIAAGEVVDRPAHLVKELLENSADAQCSRVSIEVSKSCEAIQVTDDGEGIAASELLMAITPHATSKIRVADDLWALNSFGFRGEALASIAAVSNLEIVSKVQASADAYRLRSEFGLVSGPQKTSGGMGTTLRVQDLFGNVPARKKFLKSATAEIQQIKNVVRAFALSHPEIEVRMMIESELLFFWPKCDSLLARAEQVFERSPLFYGEGSCKGIRARVCLGSPSDTLKVNKQIWLFAQNRWIQDRSLNYAVIDGYRSYLMHGEYPIAAVWLDCEPEQIDVNVHPTKSQVKFEDSHSAFRAVHQCIQSVLQEAPWLEKNLDVRTSSPNTQTSLESSAAENLSFTANEFVRTSFKTSARAPEVSASEVSTREHSAREIPVDEITKAALNIEASRPKYWSNLQIIGQIDLTYLVVQSDTAMILIDQHAAHERVAYENILAQWRTNQIEVQTLMLPVTVKMTEEQLEATLKFKDELAKFGLDVESGGAEILYVNSLPALFKEEALSSALQRLAEEVCNNGDILQIEKYFLNLAATMACHSVVRAGQSLSREQMQELLEQMDEYKQSSYCPHGRPVHLEFSFAKLEKDFGRSL